MRKVIYLEEGEEKEKIFEDDSPDLVGFNSFMKNLSTNFLKGFEVYSKGKNVKVDLTNGDIFVDGNLIDLELDSKTKNKLNIENLRWINFNRKAVSYRASGGVSTQSIAYGIGWQAKIDEKNIQRYILITREDFQLIK